jgi:hypothetical protein
MRAHLGALSLVVLITSPAGAAERAIAYADMHAVFERVERLKGGKYFKADARLSSEDPEVPLAAVTLVIRAQAGDIRVPIAPDGVTDFPVRDDLLAENPRVMTNVAAGKLSFSVSVNVSVPPVQRFKYALLTEMQDEADAMIAKQGLMARMMLPDFEGLAIGFGKGVAATATVEAADGPVVFATDAEGVARIPYKRAWRKQDPAVQLSRMPVGITLDVD